MRLMLLVLCGLGLCPVFAQDSTLLKVHCYYGSKPRPKFREEEPKWFGGVWGGHISLSWDSSRVLSFVHRGAFHWFERKNDPHSRFLDRELRRYQAPADSSARIKQATIYIPISARQKQRLDSLAELYLRQPPYDYAFFGMRCASATYDVLAQIGVVKPYGYRKTWRKMFYPRKLRKHLFRQAEKENWNVERQEGSSRRKWDWDYPFG